MKLSSLERSSEILVTQETYPFDTAPVIVSVAALSTSPAGSRKKLMILILVSSQVDGKVKLKHSVIVAPFYIDAGKVFAPSKEGAMVLATWSYTICDAGTGFGSDS